MTFKGGSIAARGKQVCMRQGVDGNVFTGKVFGALLISIGPNERLRPVRHPGDSADFSWRAAIWRLAAFALVFARGLIGIDATLRQWPAAGLALLLVAIMFGVAMIAGP
jgi:hypothetical protein